MRENLATSLKLMFGHEGGYTDNRADSGNWINGRLVGTKYGITGKTLAAHRGVPVLNADDVKSLTLKEAEAIYRRSYWVQSGGDLLPHGLDYAAFDFGVNSGPARAVKTLQGVIGAGQDGIVGGQTLDRIASYPGGTVKLIRDYCDARMAFLRRLSSWSDFGRGWTIRVTGRDPAGKYAATSGVVGNAIKMAQSAPVAPSPVPVPDGKANPSDRSITDIVKQPEAWGPLGGLVAALSAFAAGTGPVQWALAAALVAGVGIGVWYFIKRARAE